VDCQQLSKPSPLPDHPKKALAFYDCPYRGVPVLFPPGTSQSCFHVFLDEYCSLVVLVQYVPVSYFMDEISFIFNRELFVSKRLVHFKARASPRSKPSRFGSCQRLGINAIIKLRPL
jgi:hypothetical protein